MKKMKKPIFYLAILSCLLLLSGCWNRRELNELALVVGIAIDKEENDKYKVTVQVVDPGEIASSNGGGGRMPVTTYNEMGENMFETVRRMTTITPRKLYFSHIQMVVISEDIAKEGLKETLEFFARDPEFRKDFYIAIAKDIKAYEIMENLTSLEKIPSNKLHSSLETSEKAWAPTVAIQMDEFLLDLVTEGNNPVLTGLTIVGNVERGHTMKNVQTLSGTARLKYSHIAVFKEDKLIGWLNENESKGYNFITDNVTNTVGDFPCPDKGKMVAEILRPKVDVKGTVTNGKPSIEIKIFGEANVAEVACKVNLNSLASITKLEHELSKMNELVIKSSIKRAKELGVDIFGFGEIIHRADPKAWKKLKHNWQEHFVKMPVTVKSDFNLRRTGVISDSFINDMKEE